MNARGHDLTVLVRALLGGLPGANSLGVHASKRWAYVLVTADSDEAVVALGKAFELACDVHVGKQSWQHRATSARLERDPITGSRVKLELVVTGPLHEGRPPGDDAGGSSS